MYKIINYESWWSYPKIFSSFNDAFMIYELLGFENEPDNIIVAYGENGEEVVYNPNWTQEGEGCWIQ